MIHMRFMFIGICCLGCSDPIEDDSPSFNWTGGDFEFQTVDVTDSCLNGALEILFMPDGPDVPHNFEYPLYLPAYEEMPLTYAIDLREPFVGMEVTVREGANGLLSIRDSIMDSVALGAGTYGDCVTTMPVNADITPTSENSANGEAQIHLSDPRGEDERCPLLDSDPCTVELRMEATR